MKLDILIEKLKTIKDDAGEVELKSEIFVDIDRDGNYIPDDIIIDCYNEKHECFYELDMSGFMMRKDTKTGFWNEF